MERIVFFGLGNPGRVYENTRHNLGFLAIDRFYYLHKKEVFEDRFFPNLYHYYRGKTAQNTEFLLVKPLTYMNVSGEAYVRFRERFPFDVNRGIIVYDDISFPLGSLRLRLKGSDGGHKGIRSVMAKAGHQEVPRIRIGIGPKPEHADLVEYVLLPLNRGERQIVDEVIDTVVEAMEASIFLSLEKVMNRFNGEKKEKDG